MSGLDALKSTIGQSDGDLRTVSAATERLYAERIKMIDQDIAKARAGHEMAVRESDLAESDRTNGTIMLSGSVGSSDDRFSQSQAGLDLARRSLETTKKLYASQKSSLDKNALSALANAFIVARNAREFEDGLLGLTDANRTKNDAFETYLSAKDSSLKPRIEASFWAFDTEYRTTYEWYYANVTGKSDVSSGTVRTGLERAQKTLELLRDSLHLTATMLDKSVPGVGFSEADLTAYKTQNSTFLQNLESVILSPNGGGVQGIRDGMENLETEFAVKFAALEEGVRIAETNLELAKKGQSVSEADRSKSVTALSIAAELKSKAVEIAQISVEQAEMQSTLVREEMRAKIAEIEASRGEVAAKSVETLVQKAQVQVQSDASKVAIESGVIRAPFDGVITRRAFDPGTVVSGGMPVFHIADESESLVKFGIPEALSVTEGQVLDIVSTSATYTGMVRSVGKTLDPVTKKRQIEVALPASKARVGEDVRAYVRSGTSGTASGSTSTSDTDASSGLVIPRESVVSKYALPAVFVLERVSNGASEFGAPSAESPSVPSEKLLSPTSEALRAKLVFIRIIEENDRVLSVE